MLPQHRGRARRVLHEIGEQLTRWLAGRVVAMGVVGVMVTVGLLVMKVPLAVPLGLLAGALTFASISGPSPRPAPPSSSRSPGAAQRSA